MLMQEEVVVLCPSHVEVREQSIENLGSKEVRLETIVAGISGGTEMRVDKNNTPSFHKRWDTDLRLYCSGGSSKSYPTTIGYETIGKVVEVGSEVQGISLGQLVWVNRPHRRMNILADDEVKSNLIHPNIQPEVAVFWPATQIALGAIHDAKIVLGSRVVVIGAGIIGLMCIQLALLNGAEEVAVVEPLQNRLQKATVFGAIPFKQGNEDYAVAIKRRWNNQGADIVIEASGFYSGLHDAIRMCRMVGTVVTVSSYF
jgi:threonine dehydrogenase-like Zn-dependent dehydrogenase